MQYHLPENIRRGKGHRVIISNGQLPKGCIPTCRLGISNTPASLTRVWEQYLRHCKQQLTALLIDHHTTLYQSLLMERESMIKVKFIKIQTECNNFPELASKLKLTENKITFLIKTTKERVLHNRKQVLLTQTPNP